MNNTTEEQIFEESKTYEFKTEISQLLDLIINTFYSNKDIFLRELISNSSDSLNKVRHTMLNNGETIDENDLKIRIIPNKQMGIISIEDTGIGMNKEDLNNNLGTIANSGTKQFMETLKTKQNIKNTELIGQFGVGFYSSFLVASEVCVLTKKYNEKSLWLWKSNASGTYEIKQIENENEEMKHGTKIILKIKQDLIDYVDQFKLRDIIKEHSQFIDYPIELLVSKIENVMDTDEHVNQLGGTRVSESEEDENGVRTVDVETISWQRININKPLWCINPNKNSISSDEYNSLYRNITNAPCDSMAYKHFMIEGNMEFMGIIYIPKKPPHDIFAPNKNKKNFKLYVKKIFIMDNCNELIPDWLSFVRGVIDSYDLPLNVSREMLQENKIIKVMRKKLISKTFDLLDDIYEDKILCDEFYKQYSKNLKLGIYENTDCKGKLSKYLRFYTNKYPNELQTLDSYIERLQLFNTENKQNVIYYVTGESRQFVENSIFIEPFNNKNIEVIYMFETIDEYMIQQLKEYNDYKFVSISSEEIDSHLLKDIEQLDTEQPENTQLCELFEKILQDRIEKVVICKRVIDSPACIIAGSSGWTANMERIMKAQALGNTSDIGFMKTKKIMEVNLNNNVIKSIKNKIKNMTHNEKKQEELNDLIEIIYDISCITCGFQLENSNKFAKKIYDNIL